MSETQFPPQPSDGERRQPPPVNASEEAQVLGELQRLYEPVRTRNKRSLQRVRARLAEQAQQAPSKADALPSFRTRDRYGYTKENRMQPLLTPAPQRGAWRRGTATLAAVIVLVVLVGSMVTVFALIHSGKNTSTGNGPGIASSTSTSTASQHTPVPTGLGSTVYTSPASYDDFYAFAWSPDSKRIAASTQSKVQIWDATTGKHPLTYTPNGGGGSVLSLSWSPDGKKLAVGAVSTNDGLEIINPVNGTLIRTFNLGLASAGNNAGLSPAVSLSGGSGVAAVAWSPNGKLLAAASFGKGSGKIVVWDAATGVQVSTFTGHSGMISSLAWSADSVYIASTSYDGSVQVWKVQNSQVIFHHSARQGGAVAWSPTGLHLVFASDDQTFQVWDVLANKLITSYQAPANATIAWSPDGKAIAIGSNTNVILWDAATGKLLYTYTQTGDYVRSLAWSPDGKYIVSGGNNEAGGNHAKVWKAAPLP